MKRIKMESKLQSKTPEDKLQTVAIFYATGQPNSQGELNYLEFEKIPSIKLKQLQQYVGGNIEYVHSTTNAKFVMCVNENGFMEDLPLNDLAGGSLLNAGFVTPAFISLMFCSWRGTVVCHRISKHGKAIGLTKADITQIKDAVLRYRDSGESSEDQSLEDPVI